MRGYIPLLLALSASYTTITALPKPRIQPRDDTTKPKYSVVPLEPGDDDPFSDGTGSEDGNGGSSSGNGDDDRGDAVTVIRTVVQTRKPVTQVITETGKPSIVTVPGKTVTKAVPTTVSVINVNDQPVVTQTVIVSHLSTSKPKASIEPTATQKPETTAQEPSDSLTSATAPGVTSQPQPKPEPQPSPQPQPQPQPEPDSSTSVESVQSIETSSAAYKTQSVIIETVTVTQSPPASASWSTDAGSEPTTLSIPTTLTAEVPDSTEAPSLDSSVIPTPPQETFVPDPASDQGESWSSVTAPYIPPVAPTTLLTSCITTTTTSEYQHITPEPIHSSKTHDDGAWHTTYPAWSDNDLAI
ncbi:hypothetical protein FLONG3_8826 [Fusarium longipes]|uniref:Zonadhesin n=1 Tax=Fusarium longipes TaxID=694270 RepID=A0A395S280_9HYPO|nr:hypothetical protein FLONG3_8826 [Fusarium longipes]